MWKKSEKRNNEERIFENKQRVKRLGGSFLRVKNRQTSRRVVSLETKNEVVI